MALKFEAVKSEGAATAAQRPRHRSPNYPSVGLRAAVAKIDALYRNGGLAPLMKVTALKQMGFENPAGDAARVLSAVRSFGLIEEIGENRLKLSQRGIDIVARESGAPQRLASLRAAAASPPIYRELLTEFEGSGLPPDSTLRSELIAARKFNPNAVDGFIRDFRDTLDFAGLSDLTALELAVGDPIPPMEDAVRVRLETAANSVGLQGKASGSATVSARIVKEVLNQRVSPDCIAQVVFDGPVTQRAIEKLIAYLELAKDNYPTGGGAS